MFIIATVLTTIIISQGLIIRTVVKKLSKAKAELDFAYSPEGQREITMNTIKNRMWH